MSSAISQGSPISELIKVIRYSFRECEFNEIENILTEREKNMKIEMENLIQDRDLLKKEVQSSQSLAVLERLKLEDELQQSKRKHEELNKKISELEKENLAKMKCWDERLVKIGEEMEHLKREKSVSDQMVEKLRSKLLEAGIYKIRYESLAPRIMKVEEELAGILQVKVEDLPNVVDNLENPAVVEDEAKAESPKDERGSLGNGSREDGGIDDAENVVIRSPGARSMCNSAGSGGGRNMDLPSLSEEDATNTGQTCPGLQSGYSSPQVKSNNNDQDNGRQSKPDLRISSVKMTTSSFAAANIIEIYDSDDDQNEIIAEKFAHTPCSSNTNKRKKNDFQEDSNINSIKKRKSSTYNDLPIDEKENEILIADCTDSEDESCSESAIEGLLASMKSTKRWNFVADMLQDFNGNEELVLDAVCALYRQQIRVEKSSQGSKLSKRIRDLAEYLIDGDSEMRRRKSVSEVKQQRPDVVNECRRFANFQQEQLFKIYCNKDDPFFRQI